MRQQVDTQMLTTYVTLEVYQEVKRIAKAQQRSISNVVRMLLEKSLNLTPGEESDAEAPDLR